MTPTTDTLCRALNVDSLDLTVGLICGAFAIDRAGAKEYFTDRDRITYLRLDGPHDRALFIESWIAYELTRAADRLEAARDAKDHQT